MDKELINNIDKVQGKIDEIANETASARDDALAAIREFLEGIEGRSYRTDNLEDFYNITYEYNEENLYPTMLKRVFLKDIDGYEMLLFETEDFELSAHEIFTEDIFAIFELIFNAERDKKIAYINGKVSEHKPYVIRLNNEIEIDRTLELTPVLSTMVREKIDHIAFTDNEADGAKAFTNFTDGVYIDELPLKSLAEIEAELIKGAYMVR
jgi:hypothetical protein